MATTYVQQQNELRRQRKIDVPPERRENTFKGSKRINGFSLGFIILLIASTILSITDSLNGYVPISANTFINPFTIIMSILFIIGIGYGFVIRGWFYGSSNVMKYELKGYFKVTTFLLFIVILICLLTMAIVSFKSGYDDDQISRAKNLQDSLNQLNNDKLSIIYDKLNSVFGGKFTVQSYIDAYLDGKRGPVVDMIPGLAQDIDNYYNSLTPEESRFIIPALAFLNKLSIELSSLDFLFLECYGCIQAPILLMGYFGIIYNLGSTKG